MKFTLLSLTLFILATPCLPAASTGRVGVPVIGYSFDASARTLRPIAGSPGASLLGDPLDLGFSMASCAFSRQQNLAAAVGADDGLVRVLSLGDTFNARVLDSAMSRPDRMVFSPGGDTLALYSQPSAKLQIFTHMSEQQSLSHEIDLSGASGDPLSIAISDDGETALVLTSAGLWMSRGGAGPVELEIPAGWSAAGVAADGRRAAAATSDGRLYLFDNLADVPAARPLTLADDRTSDPVALSFSADGSRIYVAARRGTIATVDIQTQDQTFVSCGCAPSGLFPLDSRVFRLNEISDGPLMLLDTADLKPRVWFVPAVVSNRSAQ